MVAKGLRKPIEIAMRQTLEIIAGVASRIQNLLGLKMLLCSKPHTRRRSLPVSLSMGKFS
jgi:hypothetical protein